jgi:hypothetical protein
MRLYSNLTGRLRENEQTHFILTKGAPHMNP